MAEVKKRKVTVRKSARRITKLEDYKLDWKEGFEGQVLLAVGRKANDPKDPGISRQFSTPYSANDPLTLCYWGGLLTGGALATAQLHCPQDPPDNFRVPDRFVKLDPEDGIYE